MFCGYVVDSGHATTLLSVVFGFDADKARYTVCKM